MHFLLTVAGVVCCVGGMTTDIVFHTPFDKPEPPTKEQAIACLESWATHDEVSDMALMLINDHARVLGLPVDSRGYINPIEGETHEESLARFAPYKPLMDKIKVAYDRWRAREREPYPRDNALCWHCGRGYE